MHSRSHFDVLGFGAVAVDDLLYVDRYPPPDGKVRVEHRQRQCGGLTGTALVAAARLGARTAYVGTLGEDELSRFVTARLRHEGVDVAHHVPCPDARPCHSTIVVDQTHKTRNVFSSIEGALGADPTRPAEEVIQSAAVILIDHHGLDGTLRAARIARQGGVHVVADFERDPGPPFDELLGLVDHPVVSEGFACRLTGRADAAAACEGLWAADRKAVVVTCGASGCWYHDGPTGGGPRHFPAYPVEVVDTTGCGDVFHGAYAAALAFGEDLGERVHWASAAAALKATRRGGQAGCPTRDELEAFLAQRSHTP